MIAVLFLALEPASGIGAERPASSPWLDPRDDATVTAFAAASELDPTTIAAARAVLDEDPSEPDVP